MSHKTTRVLRIAAIVGMLALIPLLGACTTTQSDATSSSASGSEPVTADMTVRLLTPTQGAEVPAGAVAVEVEATGIEFTMPGNKNVPGEGHVHFTLDDRPFEMSIEPTYEFKDVSPGPHTLEAELVQNDTQSFDPPIKEEIEFTAK